MKLDTKPYEEKMKKAISSFQSELDTIRVGRATPAVISHLSVDYYGTPTPITQVSEVKAIDARTLTISPWDTSLLKAVEKAISTSDLGLVPQNDGKIIRIAFPPLTEDRRKDLTKDVSKRGENAKIAIRNIRRDGVDKCRDMKKSSEMTEDEVKQSEKAMQDLTDKYIREIDGVADKKSKEIMEI